MKTIVMIFAIFAVVTTAVPWGCGYSTEPLLAKDPQGAPIRSICVPVVSNDTHRRMVEKPLTDAVIKEIQASTKLVVKNEDQAPDSVLRLRLIDVKERTEMENELDVLVQGSVIFSIAVEWQDRRTGRDIPLLSQIAIDSRRFTVTRGETFATASAEASEKIARKIVEAMSAGME